MSGYLHFDKTGVKSIDAILNQLSSAGDGYHHTSDWGDENEYVNNGKSYVDSIQEKAVEAAAVHCELVEALKDYIDLAFEDGGIQTDSNLIFGKGYCFEGMELLSSRIKTTAGNYMVWPHQLSGDRRWSVYGGPDNSLWIEEFDSEIEAKCFILDVLSESIPNHPACKIRAVLAKAKSSDKTNRGRV